MSQLLRMKGIEKTSPEFRIGMIQVGINLQTDPNFITAVMQNESGFNPKATNPLSNATGLIQFMPGTAKKLGTTVDEIRQMTDVQQLPFVEAYYKPYTGRLNSAGDVYMATFMPNFIGKPKDTVIATDPSKVYVQNKTFDRQNKGFFTVGDVEFVSERNYSDALNRPPIVDGELEFPNFHVPIGVPVQQPASIQSNSNNAWGFAAAAGLSFLIVHFLRTTSPSSRKTSYHL
jgi:hypothetical protein